MLGSKLFILFLVIKTSFFLTAQSDGIQDTIYREGDLPGLLGGIENDKMLQLERMTALEFHHLVNAYRAEKGKKTIFWDDKLWLAGRNHNMYLFAYCKTLTHNEANKGNRFTGSTPENRVHYVTYQSKDHTMTGFENCAASNTLTPAPLDLTFASTLSYTEMLEIARSDAEEMFDLWKHSPGHNQNMLESNHLAHGTSIIYNHTTGITYASSVFTQAQKYYCPDTLELSFHPGWEADFKVTYKENYSDYQPYPKGMNKMTFKHFMSVAQRMKQLGSEASKGLYELSKRTSESESHEDMRRRYLKSTYYLGLLKLLKYNLEHQYFEKTYTNEAFYSLTGIIDLQTFVDSSPTMQKSLFWGASVEIQELESGQTKIIFKSCTLTRKR